MGGAVGGQNVDEGFGWDDWFSFVVQVGAWVTRDQVMEVALDIGYREPVPAIYRHSRRRTEGWVFVVVVVGGEREGREGNSGRGVLKAGGQPPRLIDTRLPEAANKAQESTMSIPQSDVSRPSALPTASLLQSRTSTAARLAQSQAQNSAQYLDDIEEEWNKKVDTEIETLVDGMVDIVSLASVSCLNTSNFTM